MEDGMPAVIAIPQIVDALVVQLSEFFWNEPVLYHFAENLTGLFLPRGGWSETLCCLRMPSRHLATEAWGVNVGCSVVASHAAVPE
jgi:hypothetical protein